jgi:2-deoxy-D-gluconate 3-dehydrogenase
MQNLFDLHGKTAIITGANTGLGQGMCLALAEAGANIVGVGRSDMSETQKMVEAAGASFLPVKADLLTLDPIDSILEQAVARFGEIHILINNAGIIRREDAIDYTVSDWDDVMNTNLRTLFFLSQAAAKKFIEQGKGGKIIHIASMLSYQGGIRVPAYTASKSAVMGVTRAMATEWAKHGINVNAIAPGYMVTNNTENLRKDPKRYGEILDRIPAGRWGEPSDMGGACVFLASRASDYVHGFTLAVDGGWLSR